MPKIVSIHDRQNEFASDGFYIFDVRKKIMMCKFCNIRIDWERRDTCVKHVKDSSKHLSNKDKATTGSSSGPKRQISVQDSLQKAKTMKTDKEEFIFDTVSAFMKSNIPLEKLEDPNLKQWFKKYIQGREKIVFLV